MHVIGNFGRDARRGLMILAAMLSAAPGLADAQIVTERSRASMIPVQGAPGSAQPTGEAPRLSVPAVILVAPGSEAAFPAEAGPGDLASRGIIARIRGLPAEVKLSAGHIIAPGSWAVPVAALAGLRVFVPAGLGGKSEVVIALATIDGEIIAEARSAFLIAAAGLITPAQPAPSTAAAPPPAVPAAPVAAPPAPLPTAPRAASPPVAALPPPGSGATVAPPAPSGANRQRAESMLGRARTMLSQGNIVEARLFLERAASDGLAEAALILGSTFDAIELRRMGAQGVAPDTTAARRWYERAQQLGSDTARQRLEAMGR